LHAVDTLRTSDQDSAGVGRLVADAYAEGRHADGTVLMRTGVYTLLLLTASALLVAGGCTSQRGLTVYDALSCSGKPGADWPEPVKTTLPGTRPIWWFTRSRVMDAGQEDLPRIRRNVRNVPEGGLCCLDCETDFYEVHPWRPPPAEVMCERFLRAAEAANDAKAQKVRWGFFHVPPWRTTPEEHLPALERYGEQMLPAYRRADVLMPGFYRKRGVSLAEWKADVNARLDYIAENLPGMPLIPWVSPEILPPCGRMNTKVEFAEMLRLLADRGCEGVILYGGVGRTWAEFDGEWREALEAYIGR
jgi:hypothetical protein